MTSENRIYIEELKSESPSNRARAGAWLIRHPHDISTRDLMRALQTETVPRIRKTLIRILELRQASQQPENSDPPAGTSAETGISVPPYQVDIAALIRHELSPAVGWIRLAADSEIGEFATSATNSAVRKMQRKIDGLVTMIKAGEDLNLRRVNLPHILEENWPDVRNFPTIEPSAKDQSIDLETDEGLFSLLLSNVFQNAIDASKDAFGESRVQIDWGFTDKNYWVRVSNPFAGEQFSFNDVLPVGNSSKMAHQGQGLALVKMTAEMLGLAVNLEGRSGMAYFSISGTRPNE